MEHGCRQIIEMEQVKLLSILASKHWYSSICMTDRSENGTSELFDHTVDVGVLTVPTENSTLLESGLSI